MIAFLRGKLAQRGAGWVHVDVGGVGYLVHTPTSSPLPPPGAEVFLHTTLQVKEDALVIYGFATADEQSIFDLCCGVAGVGPKTALALLSVLAPDRLRRAVLAGDAPVLTAVPGVGRKTAERLCLELRDRLGDASSTGSGSVAGTSASEAEAALVGLGYTPTEAARAVEAAELAGAADTAGLVRHALHRLGGATPRGANPLPLREGE